jgi:hypothetical protein
MPQRPNALLRPIVQPVLEKWPAATLAGRWLVYGPVSHVLTGVYFDGPASKWNMSVYRRFLPLSGFCNLETMGKSERIYLKDGEQLLLDLRSAKYPSAFLEVFGGEVVAYLDARRDVRACAAAVFDDAHNAMNGSWPQFDLAWSHVICGRFEAAVEAIDQAFETIRLHKLERILLTRSFVILTHLRPLLQTADTSVVADHLRTLEAEMVAHLKIHKLWSPQPFPFER